MVKKLTYEDNDFKGEVVNIYQKLQALIIYLIDTFSSEGDWVLDLFTGSSIIYDKIFYENTFQSLSYFIYTCLQYNLCFFIDIS